MKHTQLLLTTLILASLGGVAIAVPDYSTSLPVVEVPAASASKPRGLFSFFNRKRNAASASIRHSLSSIWEQKNSRSRRRTSTTASRYPENYKVFVRSGVLAQSSGKNSRVVIDIAGQRAYLLVNGQIGLEAPCSTARSGKVTPTGTYIVHDRVRSGKVSNLYDVLMPHWQRLGHTEFGIHAGYLPGRPASAGCIRLPREAARIIFDHTSRGGTISIHRAWSPETGGRSTADIFVSR